MRLTAAAFFAAALFCTAAPALAQDKTFPEKEFGEWYVYGEDGACFMEKDIGGGTIVFIETGSNEREMNFGAINPAWKGFELYGEVYGNIAVGSVSEAVEGLGLENGFKLYAVLPSGTALGTISSARAVTLKAGDKTVSFSLANTSDAVAYLKACGATVPSQIADNPAHEGTLQEGLNAFNSGSYAIAFPILNSKAQQGDPSAQDVLAYMYENGWGTAIDYNKAVYWYRKAAMQGALPSETSLGRMYQNGWGVDTNYSYAAWWYQKAAEGNYPGARDRLNFLLKAGVQIATPPEISDSGNSRSTN